MKISVVICTYMRPSSLATLLTSIEEQTILPYEILIVDGSTDNKTETIINKLILSSNKSENSTIYKQLSYYKVTPEHRGLTKQRNYGVAMMSKNSDIVAFLDDDTLLDVKYFESLEQGFEELPEAIGIGGIATNENRWKKNTKNLVNTNSIYTLDGYYIKESLRNKVRNILKLHSPYPSGVMPAFSHGKSHMYPINRKRYPVDLIIGMSMAFRSSIFKHISFSKYFEGYGLYEDADFSIRASEYGTLYIDTNVKLEHYHEPSGRPNQYKYGKMVIRNGWYIWRLKFPKPGFLNIYKWYAINFVLLSIRFMNIITTNQRQNAFTEAMGRIVGMMSLLWNKPRNHELD